MFTTSSRYDTHSRVLKPCTRLTMSPPKAADFVTHRPWMLDALGLKVDTIMSRFGFARSSALILLPLSNSHVDAAPTVSSTASAQSRGTSAISVRSCRIATQILHACGYSPASVDADPDDVCVSVKSGRQLEGLGHSFRVGGELWRTKKGGRKRRAWSVSGREYLVKRVGSREFDGER